MKPNSHIIAFAVLALLFSSSLSFGVFLTAKGDSQKSITVQLNNIGGGLASLTNDTTYSCPYAAKLVIPSMAPQGSGCMVLYPYNNTLKSLQSFQVYTSFTNASPRFVILLNTNGNGSVNVVLMSDYQLSSNASWKIAQGGQRWGWAESSPDLVTYGQKWNDFNYWKDIYENATVLSVGVALEYWAVKDSNGFDQPLYADELILNGVTYTIDNQPTNESIIDYWPMFHHDLQHTGTSTSIVPANKLLWQFNTGDLIRSSPVVANGVVYIGSNNSYFYALNAANGSLIWQSYVGSNIESSAAVVENVVYVGILWDGHNGYVEALNATNGSVIWRFATNSGIESSPVVSNGVVYIGSYHGYIYALNATNGLLKWSYLTGGSTFSTPAIANGIVYIGSIDGKIYALNANNGALIWTFQTGNPVYSSPVFVKNIVYVNSDNGTVYALDANDGSKIWQTTIGLGDHADDSPSVSNNIVYIGARNGYYAFNASNGSQIWFFNSPYSPRQFTGYVYSSPAVAGNVVYCGSIDGYLFALNGSNASIIWSFQTGGFLFSSPAIANGVVYIGSYDGKIYALGSLSVSTPQPTPIPIISPTPSPTSTLMATPAPQNITQPTATPMITITPTATSMITVTPQPTTTPIRMSSPTTTTQPLDKPLVGVYQNENDFSSWIILGVIICTGVIALLFFIFVFRRSS